MNKWLLIWNIILTILVIMTVFIGCSSPDTRVNWLINQAQVHSASIAQLEATTDYHTQLIQSQLTQIVELQTYTENRLNQFQQLIQVSGR
ncbi:hypothetical protein ACFLXD_00795 [Chloroflexota bacterium]